MDSSDYFFVGGKSILGKETRCDVSFLRGNGWCAEKLVLPIFLRSSHARILG
jgi:hypothetical protein